MRGFIVAPIESGVETGHETIVAGGVIVDLSWSKEGGRAVVIIGDNFEVTTERLSAEEFAARRTEAFQSAMSA